MDAMEMALYEKLTLKAHIAQQEKEKIQGVQHTSIRRVLFTNIREF